LITKKLKTTKNEIRDIHVEHSSNQKCLKAFISSKAFSEVMLTLTEIVFYHKHFSLCEIRERCLLRSSQVNSTEI